VHVPLPRHSLQLVGVTALWMAAKIEEIYPPRAADFVLTTDNAYSVADMIRTELQMLEGLRWNMVCFFVHAHSHRLGQIVVFVSVFVLLEF
jgi:cyclin E